MMRSRPKINARCTCGSSKQIRKDAYAANVRRNGAYLCHHCATKKAGANGKYSHTFDNRSARSTKLWQDRHFRERITASSIKANTTAAYREAQRLHTTGLWNDADYAVRVKSGVTLAMADQRVRDKIAAGVRKKWESHEYRTAVIGNLGRNKISSIQLMLYDMLDVINADYDKEGPSTTIGYYAFDCLVRGKRKILIECQGDYWHSLPKSIRNDKAKFSYVMRYFPEYEIMYIWEHEFHTKDRVLDRLKLKLGLDIETIDFAFSDVSIEQISYADADAFLTSYHYLRKTRGGKAFGAYLDGMLIGCAVFSHPIRQNIASAFGRDIIELSRFCIHPSYHKRNFASWLVSRVTKRVGVPVIAYADTTVGHVGTIYKAANYRLHHSVNPDYWYVDRDGFVMHKKTLYNRAVNLKLTEGQFAERYGYVKKYGGVKHCYIFGL